MPHDRALLRLPPASRPHGGAGGESGEHTGAAAGLSHLCWTEMTGSRFANSRVQTRGVQSRMRGCRAGHGDKTTHARMDAGRPRVGGRVMPGGSRTGWVPASGAASASAAATIARAPGPRGRKRLSRGQWSPTGGSGTIVRGRQPWMAQGTHQLLTSISGTGAPSSGRSMRYAESPGGPGASTTRLPTGRRIRETSSMRLGAPSRSGRHGGASATGTRRRIWRPTACRLWPRRRRHSTRRRGRPSTSHRLRR